MKAIRTKYIPASNSHPSRIKGDDRVGNTLVMSYDHSMDINELHAEAAKRLCSKMKWPTKLISGWLGEEGVHIIMRAV